MQRNPFLRLYVPIWERSLFAFCEAQRKFRLALSLLTLNTMLLACSTPVPHSTSTSAAVDDSELHPQTLSRLSAGEPRHDGIPIALDIGPKAYPMTTLHYFLSEDGTSVVTRYLGPGGPSEIYFNLEREQADGWQLLLCRVQWSDVLIPLARWKNGEDGQATQVSVRTTPLVEWRDSPLNKEGENRDGAPSLEWRPLKNGTGVGPWRDQSRKATSHTNCSPHER